MKRLLMTLVVVCTFAPAVASAQDGDVPFIELVVDCGQVIATNVSHQFGDFAWLEYIVETRRAISSCPIAVQTDAWVVGVKNSAMTSAGFFAASSRRQVPVPNRTQTLADEREALADRRGARVVRHCQTVSHATIVPRAWIQCQSE